MVCLNEKNLCSSDALWRQQKLPAWQPILTADTVLPAFFLLGVAFIPVGIGLLISSHQVISIFKFVVNFN
jgi:hypothetical protein